MTTVQVCTMTPVAQMIGSHRIVQGNGIVHPLGASGIGKDDEMRIRRRIFERAVDALGKPAERPTVFA